MNRIYYIICACIYIYKGQQIINGVAPEGREEHIFGGEPPNHKGSDTGCNV